VLMRYFFAASPIWGEDVPRILFIWMTYLGIAVATKRGQNLRVTFILEKFPPRARITLELAMHAVVIAMIAVIAWHSWPVIQLNMGMRQLSTGWSQAISFIPFTLAAVLMIVYTLQLMRKAVRDYQAGLYSAGPTTAGER
jgi:TRAP-type C4-dicarboxylate transport system permease small subunit